MDSNRFMPTPIAEQERHAKDNNRGLTLPPPVEPEEEKFPVKKFVEEKL
jgi:hypothetical protein